MIIEGSNNTKLHVMESNRPGKIMVVVSKNVTEGVQKVTKITVDKFTSYGEGSHSIEIEGVHYAIIPGMDFRRMGKRIYHSKSYRNYRKQFAA